MIIAAAISADNPMVSDKYVLPQIRQVDSKALIPANTPQDAQIFFRLIICDSGNTWTASSSCRAVLIFLHNGRLKTDRAAITS